MVRFRRARMGQRNALEGGFTVVEIMVGVALFAIVVVGIASSYKSVDASYTLARQMSEVYTVLSACPELDRALEYTDLSNSTNCYPNNVFQVEDTSAGTTNTYSPTITVTNTSALDSGDPLSNVYDSKVVDLSVPLPKPNDNIAPLKLRILITRNGIGQL